MSQLSQPKYNTFNKFSDSDKITKTLDPISSFIDELCYSGNLDAAARLNKLNKSFESKITSLVNLT